MHAAIATATGLLLAVALAGDSPAGATRCPRDAQPRQAVARARPAMWRLPNGSPRVVAGCQTACHGFTGRRGRLPARLPRACRAVAAHLQGWESPDADAGPGGRPDHENFTKVV